MGDKKEEARLQDRKGHYRFLNKATLVFGDQQLHSSAKLHEHKFLKQNS